MTPYLKGDTFYKPSFGVYMLVFGSVVIKIGVTLTRWNVPVISGVITITLISRLTIITPVTHLLSAIYRVPHNCTSNWIRGPPCISIKIYKIYKTYTIHNWVGCHPLYTPNNQGPFFHEAHISLIGVPPPPSTFVGLPPRWWPALPLHVLVQFPGVTTLLSTRHASWPFGNGRPNTRIVAW